MAVAVKTRIFDTAKELADYCVAGANNVTTVLSIVTDNSGKYVLFYV